MKRSSIGFTKDSSLYTGKGKKLTCKRKRSDGMRGFCSVCKSSFFKREDFTQHIRTTGCKGKERFPCNYCNKICSYSWNLMSHLEIHNSSGQKYTCETCSAKFFRETSFLRHMKKKSSCKFYLSTASCRICSVCSSSFTKHQDFKHHIKTVGCGGKERFPCNICDKTCYPFYELKRHKMIHDSAREKYTCHTCNSDFTTKKGLISHFKTKSNCKRLKGARSVCSVCNSSFTKREDFRLHIKRVGCGGKERYPCQICNKSYSLLSGMKTHLKSHKGLMEKYSCKTCNAEYTLKASLKRHQMKKSNCERNLSNIIITRVCSVCNSSFTKPEDFRKHVKTVGCEGKARFPCNFCNKTFHLFSVLKKHKEFHEEARQRYFCATCNAIFRLKSKLIIHLRKKSNCENKHSQGINSICSNCNSFFTKREDFKQHIKTVKCGGKERFLCNICNSSFSYFCTLKLHKELHDDTKKKYSCETCNAEFNERGNLAKHLRRKSKCEPNLSKVINSFCSVCNSSFTKRQEFKNHFKIARCGGKERFPCNVCFASFSQSGILKKHQEIHNGTAQKYSCEACNAEFFSKSSLIKHFRKQSNCENKCCNGISSYCTVCHTSFTAQEDFQLHIQTKGCGGKERFPCNNCNATFFYLGNLKRHQEVYGCVRKRDFCETSNAEFFSKSSLNKHFRKQSNCKNKRSRGISSYCTVCNYSFTKRVEFREHFKTVRCGGKERFPCNNCNASFSYLGNLKRHQEVDKCARKNSFCETSNAEFTQESSSNQHQMQQHYGKAFVNNSVVAFTCNDCNSSFCRRSYLKNHIKNEECWKKCANVSTQSILGNKPSVTTTKVSLSATSSSCSQILSGVELLPSVPTLEHTYKIYVFKNVNSRDFSSFVSSKVEDIKNTIRVSLKSHCNEKVNPPVVKNDVEYVEVGGECEEEILQAFGSFRSQFIPILNTRDIDNSVEHIVEEALSNYQKENNVI